MSTELRRVASVHWPVIVAVCSVAVGCGGDSTAQDDEDSSSSSATMTSADEETGATDPTTETTVDATSSGTVDPDSSGSSEASTGSGDTSTTTTAESESSASTDPESSSTDTGDPNACPFDELGPALPDSRFGNTFGKTDDFSGSCGGDGAPDVEYLFTAPAAGSYTFDTQGSPLDTVLYVLDGDCTGTELGCNDNGDGSQSAVGVDLAAGQTVTVVVDGNAANGLPFEVRVQAGSLVCPNADIGNTVPQTVTGDTTALFDGASSNCGGQAGRDAHYLFTAPNTGTFSFDTFGSSFESVLYVRNGTCSGNEIACGTEGILADLTVGQQVTVSVDSQFAWGEFDLHINGLGGACPDQNLGNTLPQSVMGNTNDGDNTESGTCGGDFSADDLYLFTAPQNGLYQFDTFGSALDTVLYLQNGGCGGAELDCSDDWIPGDADSRVIEGLAANQTVMIGVDGNGVGAYELNVGLVPCPDEALPGTIPNTVNDTTLNGVDKLQPSCGQSGPTDDSPDYAYAFTAPSDGVYTFDTFGTAFDTTLYVLDGSACNGNEIACNDDYQSNTASALSVQLVAGQAVTVVVDGDFDTQGAFTLNVNQLNGSCPDEDIGGVIPTIAMGTTTGGDNAGFGSCGGLSGNDYAYTWTAPMDAFYVFDTAGSSYDAIVYVRDAACNGIELDCDATDFADDARAGAELAAGQVVVVVVDGDGVSGNFTLTIDEAPSGGNCCEAHDDVGCDNPEVEECVCETVGDSFCCNNSWDNICVGEAIDDCGAICV